MKTNAKMKKGFTLIELLVVIAILVMLVVLVVLPLIIVRANFYYSEPEVLRKIQVENPSIEKIVDSTRNCIAYSEIVVADKEGNKTTYLLDTNVLLNYKLKIKK
jgi:prepilin-type N-terminal cleavage/methylation domain-containing protein